MIKKAAERSGYANEAARDQHLRAYEQKFSKQGVGFVGLAVDVLGGMSSVFKKTLKQ